WVVALLGAVPLLGLPAVRALAKAAAAHADSAAAAAAGSGGTSDTVSPGAGTGAESAAAARRAAPRGARGPAVGSVGGTVARGLPAVRALAKAAAAHADSAAAAAAGSGGTSDTVSTGTGTGAESAAAARRSARRAALGPAFVLMVVTLTSGGFMTYLPIIRPDGALATVSLLVWGAFAAFTRWRIGPAADRAGLRVLLPGSSLVSIAGICAVAGGLMLDGTAGATVVV